MISHKMNLTKHEASSSVETFPSAAGNLSKVHAGLHDWLPHTGAVLPYIQRRMVWCGEGDAGGRGGVDEGASPLVEVRSTTAVAEGQQNGVQNTDRKRWDHNKTKIRLTKDEK